MQRLRVGLTGLAFVFLLVMLATAFLRMADGSEDGGAPAFTNNVVAPSEPLAQLGVAPGNQPSAGPAAPPKVARTAAPPAAAH